MIQVLKLKSVQMGQGQHHVFPFYQLILKYQYYRHLYKAYKVYFFLRAVYCYFVFPVIFNVFNGKHFRKIQEVGCSHAQSLGFSTDGFATTTSMRKLGLIWVTNRMHIEIYKYPAW